MHNVVSEGNKILGNVGRCGMSDLYREQSDSSIKYIEDVLENWEQWQTHHSKLTKAMKDLISFAKQLTDENERLRETTDNELRYTKELVETLHKVHEEQVQKAKADTVRKIIEDIATLLEANWNDIQHGAYWLTNGCCIPLRELLKNVEKKYVEEENND